MVDNNMGSPIDQENLEKTTGQVKDKVTSENKETKENEVECKEDKTTNSENEATKKDKADNRIADDRSDEKEFAITSKNATVQNGGIQYNYFYHKESKRNEFSNYIIKQEQLTEMVKTYVDHSYDKGILELYENNHIVIIYGKSDIGRFTFAQKHIINRGFSQIICINQLHGKEIGEVQWKRYSSYIIRNLSDVEFFINIYYGLLEEMKRNKSVLYVILDEEQYKLLDDKLYQTAIQVHMPSDKKLIVKNHILNIITGNHWLYDFENIPKLVDEQLQDTIYNNEIKNISKMTTLVKLSLLTAVGMNRVQGKLDEELQKDIFYSLYNKGAWYDFLNNIRNIQEKLFLFVICCLNGFTRETISSKYQVLEEMLLPTFSKKEKIQIQNNKFWSQPWSERLKRISAEAKNIVESDSELPRKSIAVLTISDDYDSEKIMKYFLEEYDWFEYAKNWIIKCACEYRRNGTWIEQRELYIFIKVLRKLADLYYENIYNTLYIFHRNNMNNNNVIYVFACFLREVFNKADNDKKKMILGTIHNYFISKTPMDNYLGIKICDYAFSNIYLNRLSDDIISVSNNRSNLSSIAAKCLSSMIYWQEDGISDKKSMFNYLINNDDIWVKDDGVIVNYILFYTVYSKKVYWNSKKQKEYLYPTILYIFGKNRQTRDYIIEFFVKALLNSYTNENTIAFLKATYTCVKANEETPNLLDIYNDFAARIKNYNEYCSKMIRGIEAEYNIKNRR